MEKDSLERILMCNAQCLNFRRKYGVMETASRELALQDFWNYGGESLLVVGGLAREVYAFFFYTSALEISTML